MNKAGLTFLCFILLSSTFGQSPLSVKWLNNSKGSGWDLVSDMVIDNKNNVYLVGNYTTKATKDNLSIASNKDIFIAKFNSLGTQIWVRQIKTKSYCHVNSIQFDNSGKLLINGYFSKEIKFGPNALIALKGNDAFFAVMDTMGNFQFVKQISGHFNGSPIFIKSRNTDDGYWFAGSYSGSLIIDNKIFEGSHPLDIFIGGFNQKGELDKFLLLNGNGEDQLQDFLVDSLGYLHITGSFEQNLSVENNQLKSVGRADAFLICLDNDLHLIRSKQIGGFFDDTGRKLRLDNEQNLIWAGSFADEVILSKKQELHSNGNLDVFVCKYNSDGDLLWFDQLGGPGNDYVSSIAINRYSSIYIAGNFRGSINKNETKIESDHSSDVFIAKYLENGDFQYLESFGGTNSDYARQLEIDTSNYLYLTGNFKDYFLALKDSTSNASDEDYFLAQLYDCSFSTPIQLPSDTSICGDFFVIQADTGYIEYNWNNGQGSPEYKVDSTNIYHLVVKDKHFCVSQDSIRIQINQEPIVELGPDTTLLKGETIRLLANPKMESYLWSNHSDQSFIDINTLILNKGTYNFSVMVTDTNYCSGKGEISITVLEQAGDEDLFTTSLTADVYPNPTKKYCYIRLQNIDIKSSLKIELYTLSGDNIMEISPETNAAAIELKLNVQHFAPGIYLIIIKNGAAVLKERVAVVK